MIHKISSSLPSFKTLSFHQGLNVLLTEKSEGATERHTRNRAGKTSLIEIIHFLAGANAGKETVMSNEPLANHSFSMAFDLGPLQVTVERVASMARNVRLQVQGDVSPWPMFVASPTLEGDYNLPNTRWKTLLGSIWFRLVEETSEDDQPTKGPSFRSLFPYFARRQEAGGFTSPIRHSDQQQTGDWQVGISYLLGLDWTIAQAWQEVREREKSLSALKKAAADKTLGSVIGTTAKLRTQVILAEQGARRLQESISAFQLLPEYEQLEREASKITRELNSLSNDQTLDRELLYSLEQAIDSETPPAFDDLKRLYQEANVVLPEAVFRRYDEVQRFHESVVRNRKAYLDGEIQATRQRIAEREQLRQRLGARFTEIMTILNTHGAIEQYRALLSELARAEAEVKILRERFETAENLEGAKSKLEIERGQLEIRLRRDYQEQGDILFRAISAFRDISAKLYEDAGDLIIDASSNGPQFDVEIHGDKSKGIKNMQIFCFDMMLMRLCAERQMGPGFLVHDSHIFDGVDNRQVAQALRVGAELAAQFKFQYIVTMNSDQLADEDWEKFQGAILPQRLSDTQETGGLFGIRFG